MAKEYVRKGFIYDILVRCLPVLEDKNSPKLGYSVSWGHNGE